MEPLIDFRWGAFSKIGVGNSSSAQDSGFGAGATGADPCGRDCWLWWPGTETRANEAGAIKVSFVFERQARVKTDTVLGSAGVKRRSGGQRRD